MEPSTPIATTIVVTPRERFKSTFESLESLYDNTEEPFNLVYIDAGSPRHIQRRLLQFAEKRDFTLIRCEKYLAPNQARNLGHQFVTSKYVAFVDNDVVFAPGWLTSLQRCAEETGAMIVTPLTCIGRPVHTIVHHAGARAEIIVEGGKRVFKQSDRKLVGRPVNEVRDRLKREPTGQCEFHAVLVHAEVFSQCGKLDENNMSVFEHTDLCLAVRSKGGQIFVEPQSVVTYIPKPLCLKELPFFMLRWSEKWAKHSHQSFLAKWDAEEGKPHYTFVDFARDYRSNGMPKVRKRLINWCGWTVGSRIVVFIEWGLAQLGNMKFAGLETSPHYRMVHSSGRR